VTKVTKVTKVGWLPFALFAVFLFFLIGCRAQIPESGDETEPVTLSLQVDGSSYNLTTTTAATIRELLDEAGIALNDADEVDPPLFTPLAGQNGLEVTITRVSESVEIIPESIPFQRKIVRNEALSADDPPRIVQAGKTGLQEKTVRIVYRDGIEAERWITQITIVEEAQDEIIMIGIGAARDNVAFTGQLAYISDGAALLLRGLTAFPEQIETGGVLDGRVFRLNPTGSHLLFTRISTGTVGFSNSLWVVSAQRGSQPQPLGVENVLWAGWNPTSTDEIAYTTANSTSLPPGWEANNDLWLGQIPVNRNTPFTPERIIEAYPATYGWWGGNYAWSPDGRTIAYSYADEVGLIDARPLAADRQRARLQSFTEFNTRSDWVWVPTLSWSPDGRFLAFPQHSGSDPEAVEFDSWVADARTGVTARYLPQSGMWARLNWSPADDDAQIAFLRAVNPLQSQQSSYTLWLMDQDGSNARQIYPPPGENSFFPREQQFMAWGPDGRQIAFIFNDALHFLDLDAGETRRITQDDAVASHPTWAPYGRGLTGAPIQFPEEEDLPLPRRDS